VIVGVHGIAQQQVGRRQLLQAWGPALEDGVEIAAGHRVAGVPFDLAFYGHLFLNRSAATGKSGVDQFGLAALDEEEAADLAAAARELVSEDQIAAAAQTPPEKGIPAVPGPLQVLFRALDATFGASAGVLYLGTLRQVRRYLRDAELKAAVDALVAEAVGSECRVLVGHSLGSVAALEYVRQHPEHDLDLLLTLGSPLGLHMVQGTLPVSSFGAGHPRGIPGNTRAWVNVRDLRDPVACVGDLATWWPGVDDRHVRNGLDVHSVTRYLSKQETGAAILDALPHLGTAS
jgi:hypothetical protein